MISTTPSDGRADDPAGPSAVHHPLPAPATSSSFPPCGELAPGRRVLHLLGGGDRYEAYVVWEDSLLAPLVAKVLRPHLLADQRARAGMAREAEALERLRHPALPRGFGAELAADAPHLLLELLDGPRLSTLLRRHGPLSAEQVVLLGRQVASALHYIAHEGWVHLDVKPRNIIMAAAPKLIDLSVARPISLARRTSGVGTDAYMAPEQVDPGRRDEIGPPSDVFGLAAVLYEALTGRQAFPPAPRARFPQLGTFRPHFPDKTPPPVAELLAAALDDRPERRPTAAGIHDGLDELVGWAARSGRRFR